MDVTWKISKENIRAKGHGIFLSQEEFCVSGSFVLNDCYRDSASHPTSLPQDHFSRISKFTNLTIFFRVKIKLLQIFLTDEE
jgi:hypothetical protein